eukprot:TRINITY_DN11594_c3_g1_i1.p1 TRINITY_DN11594_c3_g1~~TRINITY_DN11594_c3_g1_i1.p1  ORF type:complete len:146 (+),score=29.27 TRINITY_DN11594_c3_g1_i1:101-538(+)
MIERLEEKEKQALGFEATLRGQKEKASQSNLHATRKIAELQHQLGDAKASVSQLQGTITKEIQKRRLAESEVENLRLKDRELQKEIGRLKQQQYDELAALRDKVVFFVLFYLSCSVVLALICSFSTKRRLSSCVIKSVIEATPIC